jgi:hypothetical protein
MTCEKAKWIPFCDWKLLREWGDIYEQFYVLLKVYIELELAGVGKSWVNPSTASTIAPRYSASIG